MPSENHIRQKVCFGDYASFSLVELLLDSLNFPQLDWRLANAASEFRLENPYVTHGPVSKLALETYPGHYSSHSAWRLYTSGRSLLAYFPPWLLIIQRLSPTIPDVGSSSQMIQHYLILIGACGRDIIIPLNLRVENMPD